MPDFVRILLILALAIATAALIGVIAWRRRRKRALGELSIVLRARRWSRVLVVLLAIGFAAVAVQRGLSVALLCAALGAVTAALAILSPAEGDRLLGITGAAVGWQALRFSEFEEWRVTGEHLRFRGRGEWVSVPVPTSAQASLRGILESSCARGESRFKA